MPIESFDLRADRAESSCAYQQPFELFVQPNYSSASVDRILPTLDLVETDEDQTKTESLDTNQATKLINDLGSTKFKIREEAQRQLEKMGPTVLPLLHETANIDQSPEVRARAGRAVKAINCADLNTLLSKYRNLNRDRKIITYSEDDLQSFAGVMSAWSGPKLLYDRAKVAEVAKGLCEAMKQNKDLTPHLEKYHDLLNDYFCSGAGEKVGLSNLGTAKLFDKIMSAEFKEACGLDYTLVFCWLADRNTSDRGAIYRIYNGDNGDKAFQIERNFSSDIQQQVKKSK